MRIKSACYACGVFTMPDSESDKKWVVYNCVEVFILHRDGH